MGSCGSCGSQLPGLHVGDYGTTFVAEARKLPDDFDPCEHSACDLEIMDISTALQLCFVFTNPKGVRTEICNAPGAGAVEFPSGETGVEGRFQYKSAAGLFGEPGRWRRQARVILPDQQWSGPVVCFEVLDNI